MSHITDVKLKIKDLDALKEVADACGFEFREDQKRYAWYGKFMGDSESGRRVVAERGVESLGKCDHALRLKGAQSGDYEIGVVKDADGSFALLYDEYGFGRKLVSDATGGPQLSRLRREYAATVATKEAKRRLGRLGFTVARQDLPGNRIRLKVRKR